MTDKRPTLTLKPKAKAYATRKLASICAAVCSGNPAINPELTLHPRLAK